jgi:hypothetical protein
MPAVALSGVIVLNTTSRGNEIILLDRAIYRRKPFLSFLTMALPMAQRTPVLTAETFLCTARSVRNDSILGSAGKRSSRDRMRWKTDESHDPLHRGSLRVHGVVVQTEHLSHVIEAFGVWISRRGRHIIPRGGALRSLITGIGQNCPKTSPISHDQGKMAS